MLQVVLRANIETIIKIAYTKPIISTGGVTALAEAMHGESSSLYNSRNLILSPYLQPYLLHPVTISAIHFTSITLSTICIHDVILCITNATSSRFFEVLRGSSRLHCNQSVFSDCRFCQGSSDLGVRQERQHYRLLYVISLMNNDSPGYRGKGAPRGGGYNSTQGKPIPRRNHRSA